MERRKYRRYSLKSLANFRDLGGYPTKDGSITRYGVFFRSASLSHISYEDINTLKNIGIHNVIDLRYRSECKMVPDACNSDLTLHTVNISLMEPINLNKVDVDSNQVNTTTLVRMYKQIIDECGTQIYQVMDEIAAECDGGTLFHCVSGKDRTGIIAMFLLSIAGVDEIDIIADYEISHIYIEHCTSDVTGSNYMNMKALLKYIKEKYGSPVNYLRSLGVKQENIDSIYKRFVE